MCRYGVMALFVAAIIAMAVGPKQASVSARGSSDEARDLPEREEIHATYPLTPGAQVEVTEIAGGAVEIETTNGSAAEVDIVRSAQTRAELAHYRVVVEHSPARLIVRHEQDPGTHIRARQRVKLRLPRQVNLTLHNISGRVDVGEVDGTAHLENISGAVDVAVSGGFLDISNISGPITLTVARLGERGIHMSNLSGRTVLRVAGDLGADLSVDNLSGDIESRLPGVTVRKTGPASFHAAVGSGGAPISVSNVSGAIEIRGA